MSEQRRHGDLPPERRLNEFTSRTFAGDLTPAAQSLRNELTTANGRETPPLPERRVRNRAHTQPPHEQEVRNHVNGRETPPLPRQYHIRARLQRERANEIRQRRRTLRRSLSGAQQDSPSTSDAATDSDT